MISMADKQQIILSYHRQGKSQRKIALALGLSRTTVFNVLQKYKQESNEASGIIPSKGIIHPPTYDSSKRTKRQLTTEIRQEIDALLATNEIKKQKGLSKQQLRVVDIHAAIIAKGHSIGYTTVCNYVRHCKEKPRAVFIRQNHRAGQAVEFDWGEVRLTLNGVEKRLQLAVFTSCYSNHRWAKLFHRQDMSSFLHAHACYFSFSRGVCQQVVYDNMRVAVAKFALKNTDKEPTEDLLKLSTYYQFDYRFCNVRKGNEKGFVERSVEYIRRKAFSLKDDFETLQQANDHLLKTIISLNQLPSKGQTASIQSRFETELQQMKPTPVTPFDAGIWRCLRIDKYCCIKVDTNYYSVPETCLPKTVSVKIYPEHLLIYNQKNELVARHQRRHTRFQFYMHLDHYLRTLLIKPGALTGSQSFQQADKKLQDVFFKYFKETPKSFIELLLLVQNEGDSIPQFHQAIEQCLKICPHQNPCPDKIKILLQMPQNQAEKIIQYSPMETQIQQQSSAQLSDIQSLIERSEGKSYSFKNKQQQQQTSFN